MANGSRHALYAVQETVRGQTPASPALQAVRITGTTLGLSKDSNQSAEIRSDRQIADFRLGANQVGGDISFELSCLSFDSFLKSVLASADWTGDNGSIKAGQTRQSWSFVRHFADMTASQKPYYIYRGCELNSMTLTIAANAIITGSFSVFGKSQTLAADLSDLGTPTFLPATTTKSLDSFSGSLKESGATIAVVTEMSLTLENGIAARFVVGDKNSIDPSIGRSNLTGSITAFFEDSSLVEKFINETESSLEFVLPDAEGNSLTFTIPRIVYTGGQPDVSGEGPVTLSMPFQALLSASHETNIIISRVTA
jgi:hypothetical protein